MQLKFFSWTALLGSFMFGITERSFQAASDSFFDIGEYGQLFLAFVYFLLVWNLMPAD